MTPASHAGGRGFDSRSLYESLVCTKSTGPEFFVVVFNAVISNRCFLLFVLFDVLSSFLLCSPLFANIDIGFVSGGLLFSETNDPQHVILIYMIYDIIKIAL